MKIFSVIFLSLIILSGCSTTSSAPDIKSADRASITLIRERAEPLAWNVGFSMDEKEYVSLSNSSYSTFYVSPGEYKFGFDWPFLAAQIGLEGGLSISPNSENFFVLTSAYQTTGSSSTYNGILIHYNSTIRFEKISKEQATILMSKLDVK